MTNHTVQTINNLNELKLLGMATEFERQMAEPLSNDIPFEQRFQRIVEHEITQRDSKRLKTLLKRAHLKEPDACIEDIDYRSPRGLEKATMLNLTSLEWVRNGRNLVFTGPTGTGKTWLACALGNAACRAGLSTQFVRVPLLLETLVAAHATVSFNQMLERLKKIDLLILDDWGLEPFKGRAQNDILELVESRLNSKSLLITAQAPMTLWHDLFSVKPIADALMDRLVHSSYNIKLTGESLRAKSNVTGKPAKSKKS